MYNVYMQYIYLTTMSNLPFAHSQFDSNIKSFHTVFIQVISLTMGQMVPGVAKCSMEIKDIIFS